MDLCYPPVKRRRDPIWMHYFKAPVGKYVFDPVFVLASVLDWAGIARNERGYLTLTADYLAKLRR